MVPSQMPATKIGGQAMRKRLRIARYRCFSCGYEERRWLITLDNNVFVSFKKCPKCRRRDFAFYRFCHRAKN